MESKKIDYKSAEKLPTLEVPPDLTAPSGDNRYAIPETQGSGTATLSTYSRPEAGPLALAKVVWALAAALLVYLIVVPFGYMAYECLTDKAGHLTLANLPKYFGMAFVLEATRNTFLLSGAVTLLSVVMGVPLAFGVSRTDMWGKGLVRSTVLVSIITPPFLRAIAYVIMAGPNVGYLNRLLRYLLGLTTESGPLDIFSAWGFVVLSIPGGVAFVFLQTAAAFENMDPSLEEGARLAGATPRQVAFRITVPMAKHELSSVWCARVLGLEDPLPADRMDRALDTIARLNIPASPFGMVDAVFPDGKPCIEGGPGGDRIWSRDIFTQCNATAAMVFLYHGRKKEGCRAARAMLDTIFRCPHPMPWSQPCGISSVTGGTCHGHDYYDHMVVWSYPLALAGQDIRGACAPGGLIDSMIRAARLGESK